MENCKNPIGPAWATCASLGLGAQCALVDSPLKAAHCDGKVRPWKETGMLYPYKGHGSVQTKQCLLLVVIREDVYWIFLVLKSYWLMIP